MSLLWEGIRIMIKRENKGGESNGKDIRKSEQKDNISNKGGIT